MPLSVEHLAALIEYLECSLGEVPCDHTLSQSRAFLRTVQLDPEKVTPWLNEHGGFCDCEVLYNVSEALDQVTYRPLLVSIPTKPKRKEPPLGPVVDTGFGFTIAVEAPWKPLRGREPEDGVLVFKLGRKNARFLRWFAQPPPAPADAADARWIQQWLLAKDYLQNRGEWTVERRSLGPTGEFKAVTVSTRGWIPIISWVASAASPVWYGVFETEIAKATSDWRDLERLFGTVKRSHA